MKVRVIRKRHTRRENGEMEQYDVGEAFDATEQELEAFPSRFEPVREPRPTTDESESDTENSWSDDGRGSIPFDPVDRRIQDLRNFDGEYSEEMAEKLHQIERQGDNRQTAHDLIDRFVVEE